VNFILQTAQGQAASGKVATGQNLLFRLLHSSKNQIDARIKSTAIRRQTNYRELLIRSELYWKGAYVTWFTGRCFHL